MELPGRNVMDSVRVNKSLLLETVEENRQKHIAEYNEAMIGWREQATQVNKENADFLAFGRDPTNIAKKLKLLPTAPISHEIDYDRAIVMLQFSVDDVIELEQRIFNQLVLDEWDWQRTFKTTTSTYIK